MKFGDKVKITNKYSPRYNQVGIVAQLPKGDYDYGIVFYEDGSSQLFSHDYVELVEEAKYTTITKFKVGDIVYTTDKYIVDPNISGVIVEPRNEELRYRCYFSTIKGIPTVLIHENELTKEPPEEKE